MCFIPVKEIFFWKRPKTLLLIFRVPIKSLFKTALMTRQHSLANASKRMFFLLAGVGVKLGKGLRVIMDFRNMATVLP
jgi:hypothetical protein